MAQDTVTGVQTIKIVRPYRSTGYSGFTKSYVLTPSGMIIKPSVMRRSRTGNHGEDEWLLEPGRYVVIDVNRPNIHGKPKPFEVSVKCIEVSGGKVNTIAERKFFIMDYELSDVRNWAKAIC